MAEVALRGQQICLVFSIVNSESIEGRMTVHLWRVCCICSKLIPANSLFMTDYYPCSVALILTNSL